MKLWKRILLVSIALLLVLIGVAAAQDDAATTPLDAAYAALEEGNLPQALSLFEQVYNDALASGDVQLQAEGRLGRGLVYYQQMQYREARIEFENTLGLFRSIPDVDGETRALRNLALAYQALGNASSAETFFQQAQRVAQGADPLLEAQVLLDFGRFFLSMERYGDANDSLLQANNLFFSLSEFEAQGTTLLLLGEVNFALWELDTALGFYEQAAVLYERLGMTALQARALQGAAQIHHHRGDLHTALAAYNALLPFYEDLEDLRNQGRVLAALGDLYRQLNYAGALELLDEALSLLQLSGDETGRATALNYLGEYYLGQGEYRQAESQFQRAEQIGLQLDAVAIEAQAYHGLARVYAYSNLAEFRDALNNFDFALSRYRNELGDGYHARRVLTSQAWVLLERDMVSDAMTLFYQALNEAELIRDARGEVLAYWELGRAFEFQRDYREAINNYQQALSRVGLIDAPQLEGDLHTHIGNLDMLEARYADAQERFGLALDAYQRAESTLDIALTEIRLGELAQLDGRFIPARDHYETALALLDGMEDTPLLPALIARARGLGLQHLGAMYLEVGFYDLALNNLQAAETLQRQIDDQANLALTWTYLGNYYYAQRQYSEAIGLYQRASNAVRDTTLNVRADALSALGLAQSFAATQATDLEITTQFDRAMLLLRNLNDSRGIQLVFTTRADVALAEGNVQVATDLYFEALQEAQLSFDVRGQALAQMNLGAVYTVDQEFFQAIDAYQAAASAFNENNDPLGEGQALEAIGDLYLSRADYENALDAYNQMLLIFQESGNSVYQSRALLRLARTNQERQRYDLALSLYNDALSAIEAPNTQDYLINERFIADVRAEIHRNLGDLYRVIGQFSQADAQYSEASSLEQQFGNAAGYARTLISQGELALAQGNYEQALNLLRDARTRAQTLGDEELNGYACYGLARVYTADDDPTNFNEEQDLYDCALDRFRFTFPNPVIAREVARSRGLSFLQQGDLRQAEEWFFAARNEADAAQDPLGEGLALMDIGGLRVQQLRYIDALNFYTEAQRLFREAENHLLQAEALNRIAELYLLQVRYSDAIAQYEQMLVLYQDNGEAIRLGLVYSLIGEVYQRQSLFALALNNHLTGLEIVQSAEIAGLSADDVESLKAGTEAQIYRNIAVVQLRLGLYEDASTNIDLALERTTLSGNQLEEAILLQLSGNIRFNNGLYDDALSSYSRALELFTTLGETLRLATINLDIGDAYYQKFVDQRSSNFGTEASLAYQRGLGLARELGDITMEIRALHSLGRLETLLNRPQARANFVTALELARSVGDRAQELAILVDFALLQERTGETQQAIQSYESAIQQIETIHADIRLETGQINFIAQNIAPYHRLVQIFADEQDTETAFAYAERSRARTFLFHLNNEQVDFGSNVDAQLMNDWQSGQEALSDLRQRRSDLVAAQNSGRSELTTEEARAELANLDQQIRTLEDEIVDLEERIRLEGAVLSQVTQVNAARLSEVQLSLDDNRAMLVYYVVPRTSAQEGQVYLFVIQHDTVELLPLAVALPDLENTIRAFTSSVGAGDTAALERLYGWLIPPQVQELTQENLVIVPHSILNYLPFAALTADGERFLVDDFVLSYAQSATFYTYLQENAAPPAASAEAESALIFGDPLTNVELGLAPLPGAADEAQAVAGQLGTSAYLSQSATETLFREEGRFADVIHLAAHGVFTPGNPLSTYMALSDDIQHDGTLQVREIYGLPLSGRSPLVVLSACNTYTGVLAEGDEFQGLTRAFLLSGARGVVASLWQVDDIATAELMRRFYEARLEGRSDAEALAVAQRSLRSDHPEWNSPFYWAAFVFVGYADAALE